MIYMTDSNSNLIPFAVDNQGNIGEGLVALDTKVLWENPNPSSSFAAQTINVSDMSEYDYLVLTNSHNDSSTPMIYNSQIIFINKLKETSYNKAIECMWLNVNQMFYRILTIASSTQITCANTNGDSSKNSICVPQKIIGIKLVNSYAETNKYSLDEVKVGTWIDGKPIYRKIYIINNLQLSHNYEINDSIDTLIKMEGTLSYTNGQHQLGCYYNSNYYSGIQYSSTLKTLSIYGNGYSGSTAKVYIEYTKTTD